MKQTCRNRSTAQVPGVKNGIFVLMRLNTKLLILEKKLNFKEGRNKLDIVSEYNYLGFIPNENK